jgi:hypothetical protein
MNERKIGLLSRWEDLGVFGLQSLANSINSVFVWIHVWFDEVSNLICY